MADSIPVIDIGPLVQQKADPHMAEDLQVMNVVRQLDEACREIGFFYVKGHGVSPRLLEQVLDMGYKFFALPEEDKLQIAMSSDTGFRLSETVWYLLWEVLESWLWIFLQILSA
jgi:isopenicillin N synthase-like dioxygenase